MTMDLFAKLDPNVEREKLFAVEAAEVLAEHVGRSLEGELREVALDLARGLAALAVQRFEVDDAGRERMLSLEIAISLVVHLDRSPSDAGEAAAELGRKVARLARNRFFSEKGGKKKDT